MHNFCDFCNLEIKAARMKCTNTGNRHWLTKFNSFKVVAKQYTTWIYGSSWLDKWPWIALEGRIGRWKQVFQWDELVTRVTPGNFLNETLGSTQTMDDHGISKTDLDHEQSTQNIWCLTSNFTFPKSQILRSSDPPKSPFFGVRSAAPHFQVLLKETHSMPLEPGKVAADTVRATDQSLRGAFPAKRKVPECCSLGSRCWRSSSFASSYPNT